MLISELPVAAGCTVVRDAEFLNLGFLYDSLPNKLVFVEAARFAAAARRSVGVVCVVCAAGLEGEFDDMPGLATAHNPRLSFFWLQQYLIEQTGFYGEPLPTRIHAAACIHPRAWIAERNVIVGNGTVIGPNCVIDEGTVIGSNVRIRAGTVIGAEGFQPGRDGESLLQMAHGGGVMIEDDVEIFSNVVIARAVFRQRTTIGQSSRLGNGCFVSHNVQVGRRCFIGHNATVNGSTALGDDVWIGPGATVANLLHIGDGAKISLGATVIESLSAGAHVTGVTAVEHRRMLRHITSLRGSRKTGGE